MSSRACTRGGIRTSASADIVIVRIPERGRTEVPRELWRRMSATPAFWELVEKRIVSVEHVGATRVRLAGACYVGRATVAEALIIEVHEKLEGALAALLMHATNASFRVEALPAPSSELGPLIGLLAQQYVEALRRYVSRGREFVYRRQKSMGSLVGGRMDVTGTIRLRARGLGHLVQFEKYVVAHNTPFNRVALAALREVDRLSRIVPLDAKLLTGARSLAILFSDCRDAGILFGARSELVRLATDQAEAELNRGRRDLLALAALLLSHESFEDSARSGRGSPRAWFLNLENLFESAVRNVLASAAQSEVRVESGRSAPQPVFPTGPTRAYRANPDLVIRHDGSGAVVGDVKYKSLEGRPEESDLYQLIVHATAFQADEAFLVYPGDAYTCTELGTSSAGPRVRVFTVSLRDLGGHMRHLLQELGIPIGVSNSPEIAA
jgi:5-methylcytosine-specific restriction endonuclease McrBC regulatory subunit McrC